MGPFVNHLLDRLTAGSDLLFSVLPSTTPEHPITPRSVTHRAPRPHTPNAPPPQNRCAGPSRDQDAANSDDLRPTVRQGHDRR